MPVVLLCGEDSYRLHERFGELLAGFSKKYDPTGLNVTRLSGDEAEVGEVRQALRSVGFLGSKRLVAISNLFGSGRAKDFLDTLNDPNLVDGSVLLISEESAKSELIKDPVFKMLEDQKIKIEEFSPLRGQALISWIKNEMKKIGSVAEPQAVSALASGVGSDLWFMRAEIAKLSAYARGRMITSADVKILLHAFSEDNIFELLDALGRKDFSMAAKFLHRELEAGGEQFVLTMLVRQFRTLLLIADAQRSEQDASEVVLAKKIGVHPYVIKKSLVSLARFTKTELLFIWNDLLVLDRSIKTGARKPLVAFDLFLAGVFSARG